MVINLDVMMKEAITVAEINKEIDEICKHFTPFIYEIHYNMLKNILRNGHMDSIKWHMILNCTFIDHTLKRKEAKNDAT